jgi:uncharacterized protein YrrD
MIHSFKALQDYKVAASDGDIGSVDDLFFDEDTSVVRWIVIDTGGWLSGRKVLMSPAAFGPAEHASHSLPTSHSREQVEKSPDVASHRPVSRHAEQAIHDYYSWEPYWHSSAPVFAYPWGGPALAGRGLEPESGLDPVEREVEARQREGEDPHLRSAKEVLGYYVHAADGDIGHIDDLLYDEDSMQLRFVVVDTRNWLPGRKVLVAIEWFHDVNFADESITTDLTRDQIKASPEYTPDHTDIGEYERRLREHYDRPAYYA